VLSFAGKNAKRRRINYINGCDLEQVFRRHDRDAVEVILCQYGNWVGRWGGRLGRQASPPAHDTCEIAWDAHAQ
jgi:hypothetical protein